jgi:hypothetical protein
MCIEHKLETVVKLLNGNIFSELRHPQAAEIDKPLLLTSQKTHIICERYTIDAKHV